MATSAPTFAALKDEYASLWASMEVRASKAADIDATAKKIIKGKKRYVEVELATGVPWFMVGIIHAMECGLNFNQHLHCGDPLTGRTYHVPKGRPKAPPADGKCYTWLESAIDALELKNLQDIDDWSIERISYELERFNGWGYRQYHPTVLSPYLWSGTNHYARGKYVADGKWSSTAVSGQSGAMALLQRMTELDFSITVGVAKVKPTSVPKVDPAAEFPKAEAEKATAGAVVKEAYQSRTIGAVLAGTFSMVTGVLTDWAKEAWSWLTWTLDLIPTLKDEVDGVVSPAKEMSAWFGANLTRIAVTLSAICLAVAIWRHLKLRLDSARTK